MIELFANQPVTTLASPGITTTSQTSVNVASSALFPAASSAGAGSFFRAIIEGELVFVTNVSGTTWTILRGQEGTTAATHLTGVTITHILTAGMLAGFAEDVETVNVVAASGTVQTLPDPATGPSMSYVTMTGNCTFTMPTPIAGKSLTLYCVQDGTGSRTGAFTSVRWGGGTAPTLSTGAGKVDILTFMCADGTHWDGFVASLASA